MHSDLAADDAPAAIGWLSERRLLIALAAVLLVLVGYPMWIGEVYSAGDLSIMYMPNRQFYADSLAAGESPLWFPGGFCGYFLHGTGQTGMFHPVRYLQYRFLPFAWAFNLEIWLSYPFMLAGTYLFLRRRDFGRSEALFGAVLFTFSVFNIQRLRHLNALAIIAQMPWVLYCVDVIARPRSSRHVYWGLAGLAMLNASQLLLGYPQYYWFSSLVVAWYVLYLLWQREVTISRVALLVAVTVLGVAGGAIQLLPTMEAADDSVRAYVADDSRSLVGSMPPKYLLQAFSGYSMKLSHNVRPYIGALPLLLSAWAIARWKHFGRLSAFVCALGILAAVMVWMALGEYGYFAQLQRFLPIVGDFRFPSRCLVVLTLACCIMSALALGDLRRIAKGQYRVGHWAYLAIGAVVAMSVAVTALCFAQRTEQTQLMPGMVVFGAGLFVAGGALILAAVRGNSWALPLLILLAVGDPAYHGLSYAVFGEFERAPDEQWMPNHMPLGTELADFEPPPTSDKTYRLVGGPGRDLVLITTLGWKRLDGTDGIPPHKRLDYRNLSAVRVSGTRWVHAEPGHISFFNDDNRIYDTSKLTPLLGEPKGSWYEVPNPMPRARLVTHAVVSDSPSADIDDIDIETTALITDPVRLNNSPMTRLGDATVVDDRPGRIDVRVNAPSRQLLVLTESYYKSWQASIDDGDSVPAIQVNGDFLGIVVERGEHDVSFTFEPESVRRGLWVSLAATAIVLGLALAGYLKKPEGKRALSGPVPEN